MSGFQDELNEYDRIRARIGEIPCTTDPEISYAMDMIRDGERPTEDILCDLVRALHARMQLAEDTLLIQRLSRRAS